jgi:membrane protein implicated in regulation of membrane protease activity
MKQFSIKKFFMILGIAILATGVFGFVVMSLWNAILPAVLGVKAITFLQALGILVLSKILFGGFGRGGGFARKRHEWKQQMEQKLAGMTPEEREKFKAEWKNRCGGMRWRPFQQDKAAAE